MDWNALRVVFSDFNLMIIENFAFLYFVDNEVLIEDFRLPDSRGRVEVGGKAGCTERGRAEGEGGSAGRTLHSDRQHAGMYRLA